MLGTKQRDLSLPSFQINTFIYISRHMRKKSDCKIEKQLFYFSFTFNNIVETFCCINHYGKQKMRAEREEITITCRNESHF